MNDNGIYAVILLRNGIVDGCYLSKSITEAKSKFYELLQEHGTDESVDIKDGFAEISDDCKIFLANCEGLD